ncbi:MAG: D-aminoacyl-tRNA deacylase [Nitrospiraceae bacterium]|nr:D-aminoacyl-tRNA deacylase [Nitrospiraceae bacterium]
MRAVVQRVLSASVSVGGEVVSSVGAGLLVFLGVEKADTAEDAAYLAGKISRLRIFERDGRMDLSVLDTGGEVLAVSQFTLAADLRKGNRPSFDRAEAPEKAVVLYNLFMENLRENGVRVNAGVFGADMKISLVNDGPVTFVIYSGR